VNTAIGGKGPSSSTTWSAFVATTKRRKRIGVSYDGARHFAPRFVGELGDHSPNVVAVQGVDGDVHDNGAPLGPAAARRDAAFARASSN
jgi:hypothetical protein